MNAARGLQIRPAHKIKPAGVAQHVQVDVQRRKNLRGSDVRAGGVDW
jgi:hypothetical protein